VQPVSGHIARTQHLRPPEKITLEIYKTLIACPQKCRVSLDLFRQHPAMARCELLDQLRALLLRRQLHLDLNDVCDLG